MTHAINRVFPVLILTGYSVLFSAFALAAENNSQQSAKKQPQALDAARRALLELEALRAGRLKRQIAMNAMTVPFGEVRSVKIK